MDRVEVQSLSLLSQLELASGSAPLSVHSHLEVLLGGVGNDFAQQLCELSSVLCFFERSLLPVETDLRIAYVLLSNAPSK